MPAYALAARRKDNNQRYLLTCRHKLLLPEAVAKLAVLAVQTGKERLSDWDVTFQKYFDGGWHEDGHARGLETVQRLWKVAIGKAKRELKGDKA